MTAPFAINRSRSPRCSKQAYWLGRQADFTLGGIAAQCYNEYEMPGMDVARMELAWHQLVLRHDMLRCRITADGQQQIQ